jgi:hypothetical protein
MNDKNPSVPLTQEDMRAWWPFTRVEGALLEQLNRKIPKPKPDYEDALL